jgi:hypothetical protein
MKIRVLAFTALSAGAAQPLADKDITDMAAYLAGLR